MSNRSKKNEFINVPKLEEDIKLFITARDARERLISDPEIRKEYIDMCIEKGIIIKEKLIECDYSWDPEVDNYSCWFAYFIWKEVYMEAFAKKTGMDYDYFKALEALTNMRIN